MKLSIRSKKTILATLFVLICAAALAYGITRTAQFPRWVVDDAFILFRYSENLAEHGELNWNPGENPVEGYTGFMLVTLLSAGIKIGISPIAMSHALGILFYFAGAVLILLMLRGFNIGSATALVLYFTSPFMFSHVWSGLETTMFVTAILFALYAFDLHRQRLFIASLLLLSLTRPEGVLLSILLLSIYRPISKPAIAAYLAPCVVYFLWRWIYYGQLLPNTFYAKSSRITPIGTHVDALRQLIRNYMRLPALLGLIFFSYDHFKKRRRFVAAALAFLLVSLYLYASSDLVMNFSYRFFVPFYILFLLAVGGIMLGAKMNLKTVLIAIILVSIQAAFNVDKKRNTQIQNLASSHYDLLKDCHITIGKYLEEHLPQDEWLVVHADAGAIPYYSKMKTRDFSRLNDEYLARSFPIEWERVRDYKIKKKTDDNAEGKEEDALEDEQGEASKIGDLVDYFYRDLPGALVFTSYNRRAIRHGSEPTWILSDNRFNNYTLIKKYKSSARNNYYEFLYIRNDLLDRVEVDHTGDRERARTILSRLSDDGTKQPVPDTEIQRPGAEKTTTRRAVGIELLIDEASASPDSLWELAGRKIEPAARIECYRRFLENFADHRHAPAAAFMIGFVYSEELRDTLTAREAFERTIELYPESEMAESARWMLEQLGTGSAAEGLPLE